MNVDQCSDEELWELIQLESLAGASAAQALKEEIRVAEQTNVSLLSEIAYIQQQIAAEELRGKSQPIQALLMKLRDELCPQAKTPEEIVSKAASLRRIRLVELKLHPEKQGHFQWGLKHQKKCSTCREAKKQLLDGFLSSQRDEMKMRFELGIERPPDEEDMFCVASFCHRRKENDDLRQKISTAFRAMKERLMSQIATMEVLTSGPIENAGTSVDAVEFLLQVIGALQMNIEEEPANDRSVDVKCMLVFPRFLWNRANAKERRQVFRLVVTPVIAQLDEKLDVSMLEQDLERIWKSMSAVASAETFDAPGKVLLALAACEVTATLCVGLPFPQLNFGERFALLKESLFRFFSDDPESEGWTISFPTAFVRLMNFPAGAFSVLNKALNTNSKPLTPVKGASQALSQFFSTKSQLSIAITLFDTLIFKVLRPTAVNYTKRNTKAECQPPRVEESFVFQEHASACQAVHEASVALLHSSIGTSKLQTLLSREDVDTEHIAADAAAKIETTFETGILSSFRFVVATEGTFDIVVRLQFEVSRSKND